MTIKKPDYGTATYDDNGNITALNGCELKVVHLPEAKVDLPDYWQAWVNDVQDDGTTRNEAIVNAYRRWHGAVSRANKNT